MKKKDLKKHSETDWVKLSTMTDSDINFSDIPKLDESFFENAVIRMPKPKKAVSLRLDDDILKWFRAQGTGYQTRINAILRFYMQTTATASFNKKNKPTALRKICLTKSIKR